MKYLNGLDKGFIEPHMSLSMRSRKLSGSTFIFREEGLKIKFLIAHAVQV